MSPSFEDIAMKQKTIMALSGGMDSTTVLAKLIHEGHDVICYGFEYGSKHNKYELHAARRVAQFYKVPFHVIDLTEITKHFKSNLLKTGGDIPEGDYEDESMALTVVPARNIIFLSIMAGLAWTNDATSIAIGIHQGDHAIYADCRTEFYKAMDLAIHLGTDSRVEILAPFVATDKAGILKYGLCHSVPYQLTRTCYKDQVGSCGVCGSCVERLAAFASMKCIDPIQYEEVE